MLYCAGYFERADSRIGIMRSSDSRDEHLMLDHDLPTTAGDVVALQEDARGAADPARGISRAPRASRVAGARETPIAARAGGAALPSGADDPRVAG